MNAVWCRRGFNESRAQIVPHGARRHHVHSVPEPARCDTPFDTAVNVLGGRRIPELRE
jgi:hypothetical protein